MKRIGRWTGLCIFTAMAFCLFGNSIGPFVPQAAAATAKERDQAIEQLRKDMEDLKKEDVSDEEQEKRSLTSKAMAALLVLVVSIVLFWLLRFGIRRFEEFVSEKGVIRESAQTLRLKTLSKIFHWVGSIGIGLLGVYAVLDNFGVNVAPLLAGAGIVGLAFGFGGQYLIRDLINGIFILVEGQFGVNDIVKIGDYAGVVEDVNLRTTTLRDMEGRVIVIPNGEIKVVINMARDFAQAVVSVGVAYKENVDKVMEVIAVIGRQIRTDEKFKTLTMGDLEVLGVDAFGESEVTIKCRIKTIPTKQWEVARELRRRIKNRFDELGIEIPFPHRTIYWGKDQRPD
jgi:small conductance mechanosensitive channel